MSTKKTSNNVGSTKDLLIKPYLEFLVSNAEKRLERRLEIRIKDEFDNIIHSSSTDEEKRSKPLVGLLIQDYIVDSKLLKIMFGLLVGVIAIGIMVWIGGIAYGSVQIDSLKTRTEEIQSQIGQSEGEITQMKSNYRKQVETAIDDVDTVSEDAQSKISQSEEMIAQKEKDYQAQVEKAIEDVEITREEALLTISITRDDKMKTILQSEDPLGYYRIDIGATWFYISLFIIALMVLFNIVLIWKLARR